MRLKQAEPIKGALSGLVREPGQVGPNPKLVSWLNWHKGRKASQHFAYLLITQDLMLLHDP